MHDNLQKFIRGRISTLRNQKNVSARDMSLTIGQHESYINKFRKSALNELERLRNKYKISMYRLNIAMNNAIDELEN